MPKIPVVAGLAEKDATETLTKEGFVVERSDVASDAVAAGLAVGTSPAANTDVSDGSKVQLRISTGTASAGLVEVPDLSGFTVAKSTEVLETLGLVKGKSSRRYSDVMPKGALLSSVPEAGEMVAPGTPVALEISDGPKPKWGEHIVPVLAGVIGLIVVGAIVWALFDTRGLLASIADKEVARGLITFLIAISTVGIAFILAITTMVSPQTPDDAGRFDRGGKQILTMLIGVLGTIVGFYFGSTPDLPREQPQTQSPQPESPPTGSSLTVGAVGQAYVRQVISTEGLTQPITWISDPSLPAGLAMTPTGELAGTPTAAFPKVAVTITGTDASTPQKTVKATIELEVR